LNFLLGVLVSGYFVIEEFGFCMFLGFDLVSGLGLHFQFQTTRGWVFEGFRIRWKALTPREYQGMIHGLHHLNIFYSILILNRFSQGNKATTINRVDCNYFSFHTEQVQANKANTRANKANIRQEE